MKTKLQSMSTDDLASLRDRIDRLIPMKLKREKREIERQLRLLHGVHRRHRRVPHPLSGRKIKPQFKGPRGETWSGRGMMPRWLSVLTKGSRRKAESYRIAA